MKVTGRNALEKIRADLESHVGKTVRLKANQGRKKTIEAEGVLEQTYPKIFVVKLTGGSDAVKRVSFSYADILDETVELSVRLKNQELRIGSAG